MGCGYASRIFAVQSRTSADSQARGDGEAGGRWGLISQAVDENAKKGSRAGTRSPAPVLGSLCRNAQRCISEGALLCSACVLTWVNKNQAGTNGPPLCGFRRAYKLNALLEAFLICSPKKNETDPARQFAI
jgi:hypothetical protein